MKNIFVISLLFCSIIGCKGQEKKDEVRIINRSSSIIDSIIIPSMNLKIYEQIKTNGEKKIKVNFPEYSSGKNLLILFLNAKGKKVQALWGLCDLGSCSIMNKDIYLFDHGINYKDENLLEPKELSLFLIDKTSEKIDSIKALIPNAIKNKSETPKYIELSLDFKKIKNYPSLKIFQKDTSYVILIDHDWNDWNNNQEIVYVYDKGVTSKMEK